MDIPKKTIQTLSDVTDFIKLLESSEYSATLKSYSLKKGEAVFTIVVNSNLRLF